ncbi:MULTISPECIES: M15 family metallopeptidase [Hungatella]|uniref:D-alanyl-D-alanine carboxypeptidase family protein n=1 Tax=Hungatella hathewayi TaxID=154046 RepID=A0AAW9WIN2_9FIRM|nr:MULTISPECIES: M15 family metallopeptidase [Hungatella]MCQ4831951.1 M15 family metallopeptidase [Hungatella sp. SL.1.14]MUB64889.1 D-alanyl-D-alanine carboxypeptidase family protein [Hungatella hathewayi]CUP44015.1 M15B family D-Ala-D-Ala carboxypeptidase VanY [Hungatella hathewayi]
MGKKKPENRKVIRNRRVMIYTFLLIFMLLYISAHFTVQERKAAEAERRAEAVTAAAVEIREEKLMQESSDWNAPAGELKEGGSMEETADGGSAESKGLVINPEDMWCLILTNAEYPVPEDYTVTLKDVPGTDQTVDERIYEPLMKMLEAMKEEGLSPVVCSGYRTLDKQEKLFNRKVSSYVKKGHSKEEANALARQTLSIPGSGEHCLGLAVDFYTRSYHQLERAFERTPEGKWLREHAQDYGFTLRYEEGKEEITGIGYEPWHFRYVGVEVAQYLKEHNLSLEEFYIEESLYG